MSSSNNDNNNNNDTELLHKSTELLHKYNSLTVKLSEKPQAVDEGKIPVEQDDKEYHSDQTKPAQVTQASHLTLQQFIAVEGRLPMRSATSGRPCSACHTRKANNPQQALCGHICCTPCWMDRFKVSIVNNIQLMLFFSVES